MFAYNRCDGHTPSTALLLALPGCWAEQYVVLLVLRRPDGSVMHTLDGERTPAEMIESYAREESIKRESRLERTRGRFVELPVSAVLGMLWLQGTIPTSSGTAALASLWSTP